MDFVLTECQKNESSDYLWSGFIVVDNRYSIRKSGFLEYYAFGREENMSHQLSNDFRRELFDYYYDNTDTVVVYAEENTKCVVENE